MNKYNERKNYGMHLGGYHLCVTVEDTERHSNFVFYHMLTNIKQINNGKKNWYHHKMPLNYTVIYTSSKYINTI